MASGRGATRGPSAARRPSSASSGRGSTSKGAAKNGASTKPSAKSSGRPPAKNAPKGGAKGGARGGGRRPSAAADRSLDRTRRAFARRQRARRWLTWRYVLAAVLVVALAGFATYAVYFSPWLRTESVRVEGTSLVPRDQVLATAKVPVGEALMSVDITSVERRVESLAAVKDVDVTRSWPHSISIKVTERVPVAVLELGGRRLALDAAGTAFTAPSRAREGLPRMRVGATADRDALQEGASVITALAPDVARMVDYLEVRTIDEIVLHLRGGRLVRWGSAEQSSDKARVLLALLTRDARVYDVSVPGAPTTR
ncbi:cell division protein FtsQ/DivIB [Nocardioides sp.]|uniref:cell division protein FtsQ/DivIB n=1 Tax=Nocardioides sp. TaxID=35761 RepID=UPI00351540F4